MRAGSAGGRGDGVEGLRGWSGLRMILKMVLSSQTASHLLQTQAVLAAAVTAQRARRQGQDFEVVLVCEQKCFAFVAHAGSAGGRGDGARGRGRKGVLVKGRGGRGGAGRGGTPPQAD
jgi:hypothetical protein